MTEPSDKVMFEIYRERGYDRRYRVVYFTELDERHRDEEITRAVGGEHIAGGFIDATRLDEAKRVIGELIARWGRGESPDAVEIEDALARFAPS